MARPDSADVARMRRIINRLISYGVEVREMPGHETRGFLFPGANPSRVVDHHDASSLKSGEWGALGLCLDGTPRGIPGPLCNVLVARCLDGRPRVAIVADGFAYHAGTGGPYAELSKDNANPHTYGVEKANDGLGEPYTAAANYAANALFHAMAVESGHIPESYPIGHKEWTPRKSDPLYSMADRRRQVGSFRPTSSGATTPTTPPISQEDDSMLIECDYAKDAQGRVTDHRFGILSGGMLFPMSQSERLGFDQRVAAGDKPLWFTSANWDMAYQWTMIQLGAEDIVNPVQIGRNGKPVPIAATPAPPVPSTPVPTEQ